MTMPWRKIRKRIFLISCPSDYHCNYPKVALEILEIEEQTNCQ